MTRRRRKNNSFWRIALLVVLIGIGLYVNEVVVPATPPLFIPTPTPTTQPGSLPQPGAGIFQSRARSPGDRCLQASHRRRPCQPIQLCVSGPCIQVFNAQYTDAITNSQNAWLKNPNNPLAHAVQGWALGFLAKYGEAELEINNALTLDPKNALAHAYLAETLINEQNPDVVQKAIDESKLALRLATAIFWKPTGRVASCCSIPAM